ncbi:uncharacterized protein LOC135847349 isoform X2 [Planococcus citri]|uniref:uncharacterized protein LOC135847349 isoform X2 n=1 Tax=Planococcus citri TaxID=170843 RepID=UPI0031F85B22
MLNSTACFSSLLLDASKKKVCSPSKLKMAMVHCFLFLFVFRIFCAGTTNVVGNDEELFKSRGNAELSQIVQSIQLECFNKIVKRCELDDEKKYILEMAMETATTEIVMEISNKFSSLNSSFSNKFSSLNSFYNRVMNYSKRISCGKKLRHEIEMFKLDALCIENILQVIGNVHPTLQKLVTDRYNNLITCMSSFNSYASSKKYEKNDKGDITKTSFDETHFKNGWNMLKTLNLEVPKVLSDSETRTKLMTSTELKINNKQEHLWKELTHDLKHLVATNMSTELIPLYEIDKIFVPDKEKIHIDKMDYIYGLVISRQIANTLSSTVLDQKVKECLGVFHFSYSWNIKPTLLVLQQRWNLDKYKCIHIFCHEFSKLHQAVSSDLHSQPNILDAPAECDPSDHEFEDYITRVCGTCHREHAILVSQILTGVVKIKYPKT